MTRNLFTSAMEKVRRLNKGPLPDRCLEAVWRELMSGSFALPFIIIAPILVIQSIGLFFFRVEYARQTLNSIRE